MKTGYVYILANKPQGTTYIGVTSDLIKRVWEHQQSLVPGFTQKYNIKHLVYFETYDEIHLAIEREKCLKKWRRAWKVQLIEAANPEWRDLAEDL